MDIKEYNNYLEKYYEDINDGVEFITYNEKESNQETDYVNKTNVINRNYLKYSGVGNLKTGIGKFDKQFTNEFHNDKYINNAINDVFPEYQLKYYVYEEVFNIIKNSKIIKKQYKNICHIIRYFMFESKNYTDIYDYFDSVGVYKFRDRNDFIRKHLIENENIYFNYLFDNYIEVLYNDKNYELRHIDINKIKTNYYKIFKIIIRKYSLRSLFKYLVTVIYNEYNNKFILNGVKLLYKKYNINFNAYNNKINEIFNNKQLIEVKNG